jgi:hypothetical protein
MDGCNAGRIPHMAISSSLVGLANMPGGYFWTRTPENSVKAKFAEFTYQDDKRCMLAFPRLVADFSKGRAHLTARPLTSTTHPSIRELTLGDML